MVAGASSICIQAGKVVASQRTLVDGAVTIADGRITAVGELSSTDSGARRLEYPDGILLPGFIDLHVHGANGQRFDTASVAPAGIAHVSEYLAATGTTCFLATVAAASKDILHCAVAAIATAIERPLPGATVLGIHLEGPYLNPVRRGAMQGELLTLPSLEHFLPLWEAASGEIKYLTLAPELARANAFIRDVANLGIHVSAGHTDADARTFEQACEQGVSGVTHLFNAMSGIHHREPGVAGAALCHPTVWVELVGDGIHVHPSIMKIALRAKGLDRVAIVTDGGALTGKVDGEHHDGRRQVVLKDYKCTLPDGTLAGSASPMNRNCRILRNELGLEWQDVARLTARNAATMLGVGHCKGSIAVGMDADLVVLDRECNVLLTVVQGRIRYERETLDGRYRAGTT